MKRWCVVVHVVHPPTPHHLHHLYTYRCAGALVQATDAQA
jgi:hypothetical protein